MTTGLIGDGISGDKRVGDLEKELGLPPGTVRNKNGRDTRSDKKVATLRREMQPRLRKRARRKITPGPSLEKSLPPDAPVPVVLAGGEKGEITRLGEPAVK